jgi:hypothetical protein
MGQIMFKEMSDYVEKRSLRPSHEPERKEVKRWLHMMLSDGESTVERPVMWSACHHSNVAFVTRNSSDANGSVSCGLGNGNNSFETI